MQWQEHEESELKKLAALRAEKNYGVSRRLKRTAAPLERSGYAFKRNTHEHGYLFIWVSSPVRLGGVVAISQKNTSCET